MLDFVMCVIEVLREIQENIDVSRYNELEANRRIVTNVLSELSNRQISHWSELSYRDRVLLHDTILARESTDHSVTLRLQHLNWNHSSSRRFENRFISERFQN